MHKLKLVVPIAAGILLGLIGDYAVGYLAAIPVSKSYFLWFKEHSTNWFGLFLLDAISQFFAYGILAIFLGFMLARNSHQSWVGRLLICYLAYWLFIILAIPLIHGKAIGNPFSGAPSWFIAALAVVPVCLFGAGYFGSREKRARTSTI